MALVVSPWANAGILIARAETRTARTQYLGMTKSYMRGRPPVKRGFRTAYCGRAATRVNSDLVPPRAHGPYSTEAVDDYLKAILELSGPQQERVTSNVLAHHLG